MRKLILPLLLVLSGLVPGQEATTPPPLKRWRGLCPQAYANAKAHTLRRLRKAKYAARLLMGWLLLADGNHPEEVNFVYNEAVNWESRRGKKQHAQNWYPALAGIYLAEYGRQFPHKVPVVELKELVDYFEKVQERTGGWFKWFEGAYKDRLDYASKDLGMLTGIIYGFLCSARSLGIPIPKKMQAGIDGWLKVNLSGTGILYGTGSGGSDKTGARGAFAMLGLANDHRMKDRLAKAYSRILPLRIKDMDKGHHVGGLHFLGVTLAFHRLGPKAYAKLADYWLPRLLARQKGDGGVYLGDDGAAGGEKSLLGQDDVSTAAFGLLLLLRDPKCFLPPAMVREGRFHLVLPPEQPRFKGVYEAAAQGNLGKALDRLAILTKSEDPPTPAGQREAEKLGRKLREHADNIFIQAQAHFDNDELLLAVDLLTGLQKRLPGRKRGTEAQLELSQLLKGKKKEIQAQQTLRQVWTNIIRRGLKRNRTKLLGITKKYPTTEATLKIKELLSIPR